MSFAALPIQSPNFNLSSMPTNIDYRMMKGFLELLVIWPYVYYYYNYFHSDIMKKNMANYVLINAWEPLQWTLGKWRKLCRLYCTKILNCFLAHLVVLGFSNFKCFCFFQRDCKEVVKRTYKTKIKSMAHFSCKM